MNIPFTKMHGAGNDFIMIDHRHPFLDEKSLPHIVQKLCERKLHIGANGLILLEKNENEILKMRYFNRDGSEAEMCGNGARCFVQFAHHVGASKNNIIFESMGEIYEGEINDHEEVTISFPNIALQNVEEITINQTKMYRIIVGVPHVVIFSKELYEYDEQTFFDYGKKIRNMNHFFPNGTNVNIVKEERDTLYLRTYERGVEEETLACGTGATATAIISYLYKKKQPPTPIQMKGGAVTISFQEESNEVKNIRLRGKVCTVFEGITRL